MANVINTRIQLKYDTLANWQEKNPTLLSGEIAIATIGNSHTTTTPDNGTHPVVFKVGPGAYNDLPFTSALAADVYAWAKEASLTINKNGVGNVVAGIEWDTTANGGKGGIKYTTASVATSEGLQTVQEAIDTINNELETYGDIVTHNANEFATAAQGVLANTAVQEIKIEGTSTNNPLSVSKSAEGNIYGIEMDAENTKSFLGLGTAAYTASTDYATAAQGTKADNAAPQATTYTKTEVNNLVAPLATTEALNAVRATAEAAAPQATTYNKTEVDDLVQGAKDYADNNDANTEYHIEYDSIAKEIKLVAGADASKMTIDATDFIKDGMINSVELVTADGEGNLGQFLKITWNDDAGKSVTYIDVTTLVDVYTGTDGNDIKVTVTSDKKIEATIKADALKTTLGLGSAAYTESTNYATSAQGSTADQAAADIAALKAGTNGAKVAEASKTTGKLTIAQSSDNYIGITPEYNNSFDGSTDITWDFSGLTTAVADLNREVDFIKDGTEAAGKVANKLTVTGGQYVTGVEFDGSAAKTLDLSGLDAKVKSMSDTLAGVEETAGANQAELDNFFASNVAGQNDVTYDKVIEKINAAQTAANTANTNIGKLHEIATTGSIYDIKEGANVSTGTDAGVEYLVFNCGSATTII